MGWIMNERKRMVGYLILLCLQNNKKLQHVLQNPAEPWNMAKYYYFIAVHLTYGLGTIEH